MNNAAFQWSLRQRASVPLEKLVLMLIAEAAPPEGRWLLDNHYLTSRACAGIVEISGAIDGLVARKLIALEYEGGRTFVRLPTDSLASAA